MTTVDPSAPPAENEGYDLAIAIVPSGRPVTWEPGTWQPDRVLWLHEEEWWWLAGQSRRLQGLDYYADSRLDKPLCQEVLDDLQRTSEPSPSPTRLLILPAAIALLAECIETPGAELLIAGP